MINSKIIIYIDYGDTSFYDFFDNEQGYMFLDKNNKEHNKLIKICKDKNFKNYLIYIKHNNSKDKYIKIVLNGKFYIKGILGSIDKNEISNECNYVFLPAREHPESYRKYIESIEKYSVFYFNVIDFNVKGEFIF